MTRIIPNCTCGFAGSDSNCSQDRRPPDCAGCGFDKFEIGKRKYLLREQGLTPVSSERMEYLMCDFPDMHKYIEDKLGRPVWTHEMAKKTTQEEIRKAVYPDFIALCGHKDGGQNND